MCVWERDLILCLLRLQVEKKYQSTVPWKDIQQNVVTVLDLLQTLVLSCLRSVFLNFLNFSKQSGHFYYSDFIYTECEQNVCQNTCVKT